jgi:glycosyltransferase involved in cell wall biosynthesis
VDAVPVVEGETRTGVLFVGGWLDVKGRRVLPRIVDAVLRRAPDTAFTLVGTGASADVVSREFNANVRAKLRIIEAVQSEQELRSLMARTAVFVMPSLSEGSPLSLLEAMAGGMGIVASRVGGIPDLVTEGVTGMMFAPGAADEAAELIVELLSAPERRASLGRAAQTEASRLTWDGTALEVERALLAATQVD